MLQKKLAILMDGDLTNLFYLYIFREARRECAPLILKTSSTVISCLSVFPFTSVIPWSGTDRQAGRSLEEVPTACRAPVSVE